MNEQGMNKRVYEAPTLTVVSFKSERGFAGSLISTTILAIYDETSLEGIVGDGRTELQSGDWGSGW